jgi:hypothetical protein
MWRIFTFTVVALLGFMSARAVTAAECIQYGAVSITGRLVRQTYAGLPDFESTTRGDRPQVIWVLALDRGVCAVDGSAKYPREPYQKEIQLVLPAEQSDKYRTLLGERVAATGQLIHGGARYDKRLVLTASEVTKSSVVP